MVGANLVNNNHLIVGTKYVYFFFSKHVPTFYSETAVTLLSQASNDYSPPPFSLRAPGILPSSLFQSPHYPVSNKVQQSPDGQPYMRETQHYQSQSQSNPTDQQDYPSNSENYPTDFVHYPKNSIHFPTNTPDYPTNTQNYGSETPVSTASQAPSHHQSLSMLPHAPSYTPSRTQDRTLPSKGKSNQQVYRQLQFPTASNNGSMKKKKRDGSDRAITQSSLPGIGDSQSVSASLPTLEREYRDQDVRIW